MASGGRACPISPLLDFGVAAGVKYSVDPFHFLTVTRSRSPGGKRDPALPGASSSGYLSGSGRTHGGCESLPPPAVSHGPLHVLQVSPRCSQQPTSIRVTVVRVSMVHCQMSSPDRARYPGAAHCFWTHTPEQDERAGRSSGWSSRSRPWRRMRTAWQVNVALARLSRC